MDVEEIKGTSHCNSSDVNKTQTARAKVSGCCWILDNIHKFCADTLLSLLDTCVRPTVACMLPVDAGRETLLMRETS